VGCWVGLGWLGGEVITRKLETVGSFLVWGRMLKFEENKWLKEEGQFEQKSVETS